MAHSNTAIAFDGGDNDGNATIQTTPCPRFAQLTKSGLTFAEYCDVLALEAGFLAPEDLYAEDGSVEQPAPDSWDFFGLS